MTLPTTQTLLYKDRSIQKLEEAMLKFKHLSLQENWRSSFMERVGRNRNEKQ
jgi:hypothetical protein